MGSEPEYDQEITLKDFFLTVGRYFREILKRWWLVFAGVFIAAGIGIGLYYYTPKTYPTKLTFMIDEGGSGSGSMLGGLLGSLGGSFGSGQTNLDRVLTIATSRRIINETLLKEATINNKNDFIANHILDLYDFKTYWTKRKRPNLVEYRFTKSRIDSFNMIDQLVLKHVYKRVMSPDKKSEAMISTGMDTDAGVLFFSGRTITPELTVSFLDSLYHTVSYYYEGRKKDNARKTFNVISEKVDSLSKELSSKQYALASVLDRSNNLIRERDRVSAQRLQGDVQMLAVAYAEGVKNREIAALELANQRSDLLLLDRPVLPLSHDHGSPLMILFKSGLIGLILTIFMLCLFLFYRDVMRT